MIQKSQRLLLISLLMLNSFIVPSRNGDESESDDGYMEGYNAIYETFLSTRETRSSDLNSGSITFNDGESIKSNSPEVTPPLQRQNAFRRSNAPSPEPSEPIDRITKKLQSLKRCRSDKTKTSCGIMGMTPDQLKAQALAKFYTRADLQRGKIQSKLFKHGVKTPVQVTLEQKNLPESPSTCTQINPYEIRIFPQFFKMSNMEQSLLLHKAAYQLKRNQFGVDEIVNEAIATSKENPGHKIALRKIQESLSSNTNSEVILKRLKKALRNNDSESIEYLKNLLPGSDLQELNLSSSDDAQPAQPQVGQKRKRE